ncbi:MAG: transglutaminase domain-containing protein [Prevotellaceae bacterium]|jgi:transglutaminase-like putative cysteine protease|nr:transglutaminase domain-containing protein [Prevotellaceae bacterium]
MKNFIHATFQRSGGTPIFVSRVAQLLGKAGRKAAADARYFCAATGCFLLLATTGCHEDEHFLKDSAYRRQVHKQFLKRQSEAGNRAGALFSVFGLSKNLTVQQREALEFLYAYMPLCDLADGDGDFFLKQVDAAFAARSYFDWGKQIPDDIFRHFVLVYRVNNEYLDTARSVFFEELKERVKGLSMADAALEVNHWCHEKVTYRGTDGRTSAPLALMRTSWGRCGEESTFTVAALRAVSIPARQCYTPRWVHTNDNHAWVEVWIDGKWRYMGACEPEPELDVAWFTAPSKRAMMVHTTVFGLYNGVEEKNVQTPLYSTINLLSTYAPVRKVTVRITDEQNRPVEGAAVKFKVYNYAELYPIVKSVSAADGTASIVSGMGDLVVWASKGDRYGYAKSSPGDEVTTVQLSRTSGSRYDETYTLSVPPEQSVPALPQEKIAANALRLAYEDSIRSAYMSTFAPAVTDGDRASDSYRRKLFLHKAQGNQREIADFMQTEAANSECLALLATLSDKDLRDTPASYLRDHLHNGFKAKATPENIYVSKVLSPRIAQELIKPWRSFLRHSAVAIEIAGEEPTAENIIEYVRKNIEIRDEENYYSCRLTPRGVYELKMADRRSRDIFFVAACRSMGIPAQVEESTGKPQYYESGAWKDVVFDKKDTTTRRSASLTLTNAASNIVKPGYYAHYTLAFFKDGDFQTLDFEDSPATAKFPFTLTLDEGYYRLMTGSRANDGSVTVSTQYFELRSGQPLSLAVKMPEVDGKLFVKGIVDMNTVVAMSDGSKKSLKALSNGKGLMLCFVDVGKEPSKHILQDLPAQQKALEEWGGGIALIAPDDKLSKAFSAATFKNLPAQTTWSIDANRSLLKAVASALQVDFRDEFPLAIYLSTNGGILYSSIGYRIGIGEDIVKCIRMEQESCSR